MNSRQGDSEIMNILEKMGAKVTRAADSVRVSENKRKAVEINAAAIPDLIPILALVAAVSEGQTVVKNAARLRIKESDRLASTAATLNALGANVVEKADSLQIQGVPQLKGGTVDAWGDHRIAMMAAIAATATKEPVTITGAQAIRKSYPQFFDEMMMLGASFA
jgi:3-phosphoshikimate 1-carboxyvinyltransferase